MTSINIVQLAVSLLLGGSGWAAIYAFLVRPRVYIDSRACLTVPVIELDRRAKVELALRQCGVPLCYVEVEWWNNGRSTAKNIEVELTSTVPITEWELAPNGDDFGAPWSCTLDPKTDGADSCRLRLAQQFIRPGSRCRLVVGFDLELPDDGVTVRAFSGDRTLPAPGKLQGLHSLATVVLALGLVTGVPVAWSSGLQATWGPMPTWLFVVWLIASIFVARWVSGVISPGQASWDRRTGQANKPMLLAKN
jgi:hypothetical protein